jgi:O-methyltransferase
MLKTGLRSLGTGLRRATDPINRNDRYGALYKAWGYVFSNHLEGDYYEFGVFDGKTVTESFLIYEGYRNWLKRETQSSERWRREPALVYVNFEAIFYGLDTFEGMPANNEGNQRFAKGMFECSIDEVAANCAKVGLIDRRLKLLKGLFSSSGPALLATHPRRAAIINLDCDLYSSAKDALAICEKLIQNGTVLLCDDYNHFCASSERGERKALAEFSDKTRIHLEPWFPYQFCGQALLCHL